MKFLQIPLLKKNQLNLYFKILFEHIPSLIFFNHDIMLTSYLS